MNTPLKALHPSSPMVLQTMLDEARRELFEAKAKIEHQAAHIAKLESRLTRHPELDDILHPVRKGI